jgi:hypothetical protein
MVHLCRASFCIAVSLAEGGNKSAIGTGNVGPLNLAGSFAGVQRASADPDRDKAESAVQKFQADQQALAAHGLSDVAEAELTGDRDADGQSAFGSDRSDSSEPANPPHDHAPKQQGRRAPDAMEERRTVLDLEA